jgi:hypothetical protein
VDAFTLDLRGGPLGPGATPEADGTGEIEMSLIEAPGTVLQVVGTAEPDLVQLGSLGGGNYGVNLNALTEATADVDITARTAFFGVALGGGDDQLDPHNAPFAIGGFGFGFFAFGGPGDDLLPGNDRRNFLFGGTGDDRLVGAGRRDILRGNHGDDRIDARDRGVDSVGCGRGEDATTADPIDRIRGCEH